MTRLILIAASFASAAPSYAEWSWTRLDYPGALWTFPYGISGNNIVGAFQTTNTSHEQGFFYDGSSWKTLNSPGAVYTVPTGVSGDTVVGYYYSDRLHGFLYQGGKWTTLDFPDAKSTECHAVSGGKIVGFYTDSDSVGHGFLYDGSKFEKLEYPGRRVNPNGICGDKIVGGWSPGQLPSPFVYDGTTWKDLRSPGWYMYGEATAIDGSNIIGYRDDGDRCHGFLYNEAGRTDVEYPGTQSVALHGISGNRMVGNLYMEGSATDIRGFILTIPEPATFWLVPVLAWSAARRRRRAPN